MNEKMSENESLDFLKNQLAQARTEIRNLRQQISALKHLHSKDVNQIASTLNGVQCQKCASAATPASPKLSPKRSAKEKNLDTITLQPIGVIETSFVNKRALPRQTNILSDARGVVVINTNVFSNPEHALSGLQEFSHMWILFYFHQTESVATPAKVAPPRLRGARVGVFSTRSPHRPCPVGLSLVEIHRVEGNRIHFRGVDMVNGTPVLDVKPYIPQYDCPALTHGVANSPSCSRESSDGAHSADKGAGTSDDTNRYDHLAALSIDTDAASPITPSPESPLAAISGSVQRMGLERGDPDGQERSTPPQNVRIASWIDNQPMQKFTVKFTDQALARLTEIIGDRAESFKRNIECLLSEDPRSLYIKTKYADHEYCCVLEDVSIGCIFDDANLVCTIINIRAPEDI